MILNKRLKEHQAPIRVLLVVRWPVGGIRTFMRYVYRRFPVELFQFVLIAPNHAETRVLLDDLAGIDLVFQPVSEKPSALELGWAVFRQLLSGNFQLVHAQGFISGVSAAVPAALFRVPHVMTSHDVICERQFWGPLGWLKRITMKIAFSLIGNIHSVSHDAQANLLEFFPMLRNRCLVISNGIEVEQFQKAEPRNLRKELGIEDEFLIGFLGRFMGQKGFIHLVNAVEHLSRQELKKKFVVVAVGGGGFVREDQISLTQRGLGDYFRFLPFTANVAGVIKGLDLVVMPSLWEACPLLPMEVLTCGVPLITSNCIGLREVVQGTPTIVVQAGDSYELARKIMQCLDQDHSQYFNDYAAVAAQRYDVSISAKSILNLIYKVTS